MNSVNSIGDVLTEADCLALLRTRTFGRIAFTSGALPVIAPVEYVFDDGAVTFRTESALKLGAASHGDVLAFEIDSFDHARGEGWTVLVLGRATLLTADAAMVPTLDEPGAEAPHYHFVRLHCERVSGRRLYALAD